MSQLDTALRARADEIVAGLPKRSLSAAAKRVAKAKDHYGKARAVEKQAEWKERVPVLWALLRAGHLELDDPPLWQALSEQVSTVDGADVAALLSGITSVPADQGQSVAGWPGSLDAIVCEVYARDPGPIRDAAEGFSESVARGFASVRLRFGEIGREELPGSPEEWARAMAQKHIERYGVGQSVGDKAGIHRYVRWPAREADDPGYHPRYGVDLWLPAEGRPAPAFYEYIELFTTREAWTEAVLERVRGKRFDVPLAEAEDAFRVADLPTLAGLLRAMRDPDVRAWRLFEELRPDLGPKELLELASLLAERGEDRVEDVAAACAVLRLAEAGEAIPEEATAHLRFAGYESGYGSGYGAFFEARERYLSVLHALGEEGAKAKLLGHLQDAEWKAERALPFVADFLDDTTWEAALAVLREAAPKKKVLSHWMIAAKGLARLGELHGEAGAERLAAALDRAEQEVHREGGANLLDGLGWAMLELLAGHAERGESWDPKHDRFLRFDWWNSSHADYDFTHYAAPALARAISGLPPERMLEVFERGLDPARNPSFARPYSCLMGEHIPDAVIEAAMRRLITDGARAQQPYMNWIEQLGHDERLGRRLDPFVARALKEGLPELPASWLKRGMGEARWEALGVPEEELAEELPEEPVARLLALTEQVHREHPDLKRASLYALRSLEAPPEEGAINRVDGLPIGVTRESWPRNAEGELLMHVLTLDLDQVGSERPRSGAFKEARALALFIKNPMYNEAYEPGTENAVVLALSEEDLEKGVPEVEGWELWEESSDAEFDDPGRALEVVEIGIPIGMGSRVPEATREEIRKLSRSAPGQVGGYPSWIQEDPFDGWGFGDPDDEEREEGEGGGPFDPGEFVLQLDERLANINLGDMGLLYVFTNTAFWQCY